MLGWGKLEEGLGEREDVEFNVNDIDLELEMALEKQNKVCFSAY